MGQGRRNIGNEHGGLGGGSCAARLPPRRQSWLRRLLDCAVTSRWITPRPQPGCSTSPGGRRGSLIDCMIAAAAIADSAPIATGNTSDFRRFEDSGLTLTT